MNNTTATATPGPSLVQVDPRELLVDINVRRDVRLDKGLVDSVRDLGVLVPIVAVRTTEGALRVRFGHRRTLAAVEASRDLVPVVVVADEASDDATHIERLVGQYAENEHRAALTNAERVDVVTQLHAFGVTPAQIAKRTQTPRATVDAALVVAGSDLALAATERYEFLDLLQAAVVAEFQDDPETVKALVVAAQRGQFDHYAQRARNERAEKARRDALADDLRTTGLRVLGGPLAPDATARRLDRLKDSDGERLSVESHADCPGHAAYVGAEHGYIDPATGWPPVKADDSTTPAEDQGDEDDQVEDEEDYDDEADYVGPSAGTVWGSYPAAVYVCLDPVAHGHRDRWQDSPGGAKPSAAEMTQEQREQASAERRDVIESNKAWRAADTVRLDWLRTSVVARKTAPKGTSAFLATAIAQDPATVSSTGANHLAADLLGCEATAYGQNHGIVQKVSEATEARAQVLALVLVLAGYEDGTSLDDWRRPSQSTRRYLTFLSGLGYVLSDVERRACGETITPAETTPAETTPTETD